MKVETRRQPMPPRDRLEAVFHVESLDAIYGSKTAVKDVTMEVYKNLVTAIIGPSGCGKSTFIRCFNRMNDLIPGFTQTGDDALPRPGHLRERTSTRSRVRRHIGMVFQRPNPFPKSIYDNVALGLQRARDEGQPRRARRARAHAGGALGRGEGPARRRARSRSPAASSSGSASRARSPSSRRSCSWTSPRPRSTRSRRRRSRS